MGKKKNKGILCGLGCGFIGIVVGLFIIIRLIEKGKMKWKNMSDKHLALMLLYNQWMITKQRGKNIADYLQEEGISNIAIYGMSYVGERLLDELVDSDVEVKYAIDQNSNGIYAEVEVYSPDDDLEDVDAIIVTPVFFFDEIKEKLSEKVDCPILSLEDILYDI